MKFFKHTSTFGLFASAFLLSGLTSCLNDNWDCPDIAPTDADAHTPYILRLNVSAASNASTRSSGHDTENATDAEKYIDLFNGDYAIAIYDGNGNYLTQIDGMNAVPHQENGYYWIECVLDNNWIEKIQENGNDYFQAMVVANWKAYDKGTASYSSFAPNTIEQLWENGTDYNFDYQAYVNNSTIAWTPDIEARRCIPMFGTTTGQISTATKGMDDFRHIFLNVPMLRALAKVEVIDNIQGANIEEVSMTKYNTTGRYIPNVTENPNWSGNDQQNSQVVKPSLPADATTGTDLKFISEAIPDGNGKKKWVAYIPEMQLGETTIIDAVNRPRLDVQIQNGGTYPLHFAQYTANQEPSLPNNEAWNYILRNHIYRYTINSVSVLANLEVEVANWDAVTDDAWDYTDNIVINTGGFLTWDASTVLNDNREDAMVTLQGSTEVTAVATFTISAPSGATWYASFVTLEGEEDAFMFVDENGEELTNPSGSVGTQGVIRIRNKYGEVIDHNNRGKLVIMVQTGDGRWMEADLCEGNARNYIVVQNQTNI